MASYFQIFPPLVFSYRLFIFTNRGNFQARTWVWRKFAAENRVKEGIGQESNGAANQEKQIFLLCQISPSASSTRDLGTRLCLIVIEYNNIFEIFLKLIVTVILKEIQRDIALLKLFCFRASELFSRTLKKGDGDFPDVACLFFSTLSYMWDRGNEVALS